jgi:hypothetical protein
MSSKIKNIIIFGSLAILLIILYIVFIKKSPEDEMPLVSETGALIDTSGVGAESQIASDFLSTLLSVKNISLNNSIFSDPAFLSLRDSSIELVPDGNEGRPNPFAPIGSDVVAEPVFTIPDNPIDDGTFPPTLPN